MLLILKGLTLVGWQRKTSKQTFTRSSAQGSTERDARGVVREERGGQRRTGSQGRLPSGTTEPSFGEERF